MLCAITRRMISRAEDAGTRLPRIAERHAARCGACGEFARSAASLASRLRSERAAWLAAVPEFPAVRGLAGAAIEPEASAVEARAAGPRRAWFALRPLPAAAAALILAAAGLFLFQIARQEPPLSERDRAAAQAAFKRLTSSPEEFRGVLGEPESSLEKERRILEKSVSSAIEYLQARLNIRIERRETPKPL